MRWLFLASLLFSSRAVAEQIEPQFALMLEKGVGFGTSADGVISRVAPANLNLELSAYVEEDFSKRWRLGLVVPLQQRVALGLAPGLTLPLRPVLGRPLELGLAVRGFISPYFVTDADRMEAVLEEPYLLICEEKISSMKDLIPVLEQVARSSRPPVIIAEDSEGEAGS